MGISYKDAGVDIDKGNEAVIKDISDITGQHAVATS